MTNNTQITVAGRKFDIGTPVINWKDKQGFNGYNTTKYTHEEENRKTGKTETRVAKGRRYTPRKHKKGLEKFKQIVIHHTGGFTAERCFKTLHEHRKLSVQFIPDDHGIIYQPLDAVEYAWHAGKANPIASGIEAVLFPDAERKPDAYSAARCERLGLAPHKIITQTIKGRTRKVFAMPDKQIDSIARLCAGLWYARAFLKCEKSAGFMKSKSQIYIATDLQSYKAPFFPMDKQGEIPLRKIPDPLSHEGLILHMQLSSKKWDAAGIRYGEFERVVYDYYSEMVFKGFLEPK